MKKSIIYFKYIFLYFQPSVQLAHIYLPIYIYIYIYIYKLLIAKMTDDDQLVEEHLSAHGY